MQRIDVMGISQLLVGYHSFERWMELTASVTVKIIN